MKLLQVFSPAPTMEQEFEATIDRSIASHWDRKIRGGIVPTEVKMGKWSKAKHKKEMKRLAQFELEWLMYVLGLIHSQTTDRLFVGHVHYLGIGTAEVLSLFAGIANSMNFQLRAYDISTVGCDNARAAFSQLHGYPLVMSNMVYQVDAEFVCDPRFMDISSRLLVLPRILDVINVPVKKGRTEQQHAVAKRRKMQRTCRRIGRLLKTCKALLIHPEPEGNEHAVFGDTTLYPLELLAASMQRGLGSAGKVEYRRLGKIDFYGHIYTAVLVEAKLVA